MNIITANEIKRFGVAALEKQIESGPVHVFKHNRPLFVVISENDYQAMLQRNHNKSSGLLSMLKKGEAGNRTREDIDSYLQNERNDWDL